MKRPATATIAVFLGILVVAAVIAGVVVATTDGAPAVEVGDRRVAEQSVNEELEAIVDSRPGQASNAPGSVVAETSAGVATDIVRALLTESILDRRGERITGDDRATVGDIVQPGTFRGYPDFFRERYAERIATIAALARVLDIDLTAADSSSAFNAVWRREARRVGVTVDPVYGRWVPALAAVVPYSVTEDQIRDAVQSQ